MGLKIPGSSDRESSSLSVATILENLPVAQLDQSNGLLNRRSGVRISPGRPNKSGAVKRGQASNHYKIKTLAGIGEAPSLERPPKVVLRWQNGDAKDCKSFLCWFDSNPQLQ